MSTKSERKAKAFIDYKRSKHCLDYRFYIEHNIIIATKDNNYKPYYKQDEIKSSSTIVKYRSKIVVIMSRYTREESFNCLDDFFRHLIILKLAGLENV